MKCRLLRQWAGDSRGSWDGDTLVVETTNFLRETSFGGSSANLHLVERFTRTGPDTLTYSFTATDPTTWAGPWTAEVRMTLGSHHVILRSGSRYRCSFALVAVRR